MDKEILIGKLHFFVMEDKVKITGSLQICAGKETGVEAAIDSMDWMHKEENTNAILLAGAENIFN